MSSFLIQFVVRIFKVSGKLIELDCREHVVNARLQDLFGIATVVPRLCEPERYDGIFIDVYFGFRDTPSFPAISPNCEAIPLKKGPTLTMMISYMIG